MRVYVEGLGLRKDFVARVEATYNQLGSVKRGGFHPKPQTNLKPKTTNDQPHTDIPQSSGKGFLLRVGFQDQSVNYGAKKISGPPSLSAYIDGDRARVRSGTFRSQE